MNYQNLFNQDFYPTPVEVIDQMLETSDVSGKVVLEPSFGSCNIVSRLLQLGASEVIGCEINDRLRTSARGVRVIGTDFLAIREEQVSHIDMMVMNPPFSQQERHIMHAWDIAPGGCEIISLCNATLLDKDRWMSHRQIAKIIELHGSGENIGPVFQRSDERRTGCDIAILRLYKPGTGEHEFDGYFTDEADDPELQGNGIIQYSFVREAVQRYIAAVSRVDAVLEAGDELNELTKPFGFTQVQFGAFGRDDRGSRNPVSKEVFRKELQKAAWKWIFDKFNMGEYVTSGVMSTINKFVERQSAVPFTMKNIYRMVEMIVGTHGSRMQKVLEEAFDHICSFSKDNVTQIGKTWRTNSAHMVNKKFIIPGMCYYDARYGGKYISFGYGDWCYGNLRKIDDVVKALCHITGKPYKWVEYIDGKEEQKCLPGLREALRDRFYGQWYNWTFFRVKCFKKGTMHFEFIDEDVWAKFNQAVASSRGWVLPANVKTKKGGRR